MGKAKSGVSSVLNIQCSKCGKINNVHASHHHRTGNRGPKASDVNSRAVLGSPVLKELKWLPVATQLYFRSAIMAFKCLSSRVPEYLSSQFSKRGEISGRATRSSQMLNIPLFKSASGQRTFYYRTVSIWNSMDSSLKTLEKVSAFKFYLKRKLIKDFIDS